MMASDQWEFADTGSVRIPDDAPLGSFEQGFTIPSTTGMATQAAQAAAPSSTSNWINAIAQVAQAGSQAYATYVGSKVPKTPETRTVYVQQPQLAPVSAALPPWALYSLIGAGVLGVGVVAYLLLK